MKIIFLARELDSSKIMADLLRRNNWADRVVFETGVRARKKKLRRMLSRRPLWRIFLLPLDILFLLMMTRKANKLFYQCYSTVPRIEPDHVVTDANDIGCIEYLKQEKPDILVIYGTAILKKSVLSIPKVAVINVHGAIVPKYRNVHGEFWAVAHEKFNELGTSILITNEGIDSGDIVEQRTLNLKHPVSVSQAKLMVFQETLRLIAEVMPKIRQGIVPRRPQAPPTGPNFQTPTFADWLKFRVPL